MRKTLPKLRESLFWDTEVTDIDWGKQARFVISRVMHRGTLKEWEELQRFYGNELIKRELPNIRWGDPKTKHFFHWLYDF